MPRHLPPLAGNLEQRRSRRGSPHPILLARAPHRRAPTGGGNRRRTGTRWHRSVPPPLPRTADQADRPRTLARSLAVEAGRVRRLRTHLGARKAGADLGWVDPRTYLPVVQRQVLLPTRGRHVEGEDELVGYRRLPLGTSSEALLKVVYQHPHARVLVERPAKLGHARPPKLPGRTPALRPHARVLVERPARLGWASRP
jgi:hypothetical protein